MKSKEARKPTQDILDNFLSENEKYQIQDKNQSTGNLDEISSNDEVWFVQCPKGIQPQQLLEHKIKLPGKSNCNLIETFAEEFSITSKEICLGYKNDNDHFKIKQFPLKGSIIVREKLKIIETENREDVDDNSNNRNRSSVRVPFPSNLKIRHPLHGHQFEYRINLAKDIRERLQKSDNVVKTERKNRFSEKDSSKKRKKKKEIKDEQDEHIPMDISWINNI